MASLFSKGASKGEGAFKLGERAQVLDSLHTPIIPAIVQRQGVAVYEEAIWSSTCTLLVDTVSSEYAFCADFFGAGAAGRGGGGGAGAGGSGGGGSVGGSFENIFGKTLIHLLEHLEVSACPRRNRCAPAAAFR